MDRARAAPEAILGELVGRQDLITRVLSALEDVDEGRAKFPLLTLVGTPGIGKTRIARELISRLQSTGRPSAFAYLGQETPDTVEAVARRVQEAYGLPDHSAADPVDMLITHLAEQDVPPLLVLDNCEQHVASVGDLLTDLLGEVPRLQILATSRAELGLYVETLVPLKPLSIPAEDPDVADDSESMTLLRNLLQGYGVDLGPEHGDSVRKLARWAGGLPLVLGIIAARIKGGMPPATLLKRLPWLLTSRGRSSKRIEPHHVTLAGMLDDSYELCDDPQRLLLGRLSVFAGGADVDSVEQVCSGQGIDRGAIGDALVGLANQGLVEADPASGRYGMQPAIREYGLARLRQRGEEDHVRAKHAEHFNALAQTAAEEWIDPASEMSECEWLDMARLEMDNFRAALSWCLTDRRIELGLAITVSLARLRLWWYAGLLSEAVSWMKQFMQAAPPHTPSPEMLGAAGMLGWIQLCQGNQRDAAATLQRCRDIHTELAAPVTAPQLDFLEGAYLLLADNDARSLTYLRSAWSKVDALVGEGGPFLGDRHQINLILGLGAGLLGGTPDLVETCARRTIDEADNAGAEWARTWGLWVQGLLPLFHGDPADALDEFQTCLRQQIALGDRWGTVWTALAVHWALARLGEHRWAAQVHGGSTRLQEAVGSHVSGLAPFAAASEHAQQLVIDALGRTEHDKHFEAGRRLTSEQIHATALRGSAEKPRTADAPDRQTKLTDTETQVVKLVRSGAKNREIAEALFISVRTVETHLGRVYAKLGLPNRAAVASWATENLPPHLLGDRRHRPHHR